MIRHLRKALFFLASPKPRPTPPGYFPAPVDDRPRRFYL